MSHHPPNDDVPGQPASASDPNPDVDDYFAKPNRDATGSPLPPPPPPPPVPPQGTNAPSAADIRTWTIAAHASALVGAFVAVGAIGPLVVYLIRKDVDPISASHAKDALNWNLSVLVYGAVALVLSLAIIGFFLLLALGIYWLVNVIRATVTVASGRSFGYPNVIRFVK